MDRAAELARLASKVAIYMTPKGHMRITAKCYSGLNPAPFSKSALSAT